VLVDEGFTVLPYINADPILARKGGSRRGHRHASRISNRLRTGPTNDRADQNIIENAHVPVVVDAGIGAPSDAALAMELGADAVLVNTAIAEAGPYGASGHASGR
jgi:thiazole synthase